MKTKQTRYYLITVLLPLNFINTAVAEPRTQPKTVTYFHQETSPAPYFKSAEAACQSVMGSPGWKSRHNYDSYSELNVCAGGIVTVTKKVVWSFGGVMVADSRPLCKFSYVETGVVTAPASCYVVPLTEVKAGEVVENVISVSGLCPVGWSEYTSSTCASPEPPKPDCSVGNPVDVSGCKFEDYALGENGVRRAPAVSINYSGEILNSGGLAFSDPHWFVDPLDRRLLAIAENPNIRYAVRSARRTIEFRKQLDNSWTTTHPGYKFWTIGSFEFLYDPQLGVIERYASDGSSLEVTSLAGYKFTLANSPTASPVATLTDVNGRTVSFPKINGSLDRIVLNGGRTYSFALGAAPFSSKLSKVINPDLSFKEFLYSESPFLSQALSSLESYSFGAPPPPLTDGGSTPVQTASPRWIFGGYSSQPLIGVKDETQTRLSTFTVTDAGVTTATERAGGVGKFTLLITAGVSTVSEPLGATQDVAYQQLNPQRSQITTLTKRSADGRYRSDSNLTYNAAGALTREVFSNEDNVGYLYSYRTLCYDRDPIRELELTRLEKVEANLCSSLVPTPGTADRLVSTQWHPDWVSRTRVAEPKKVTTWVYQGQPDPTASGAIANCLAAGASLLPNGKPYAVLCKQVEQTTSDDNGALGFLAPAVGAARVWSYTYGVDGQVLTEKGPRTDVVELTTYEYFATTDTAVPIKWWKGDLKKMTNPKGQITIYDEYEPNGKVKKMTDANGLVTTYTYHVRDWLTGITRTVGGTSLSTTLEYWPTGKLKKVTNPDDSFLSYTYDAAQRLVGLSDNIGNQVAYTLDNASNRIKEEFKDPAGTLKRNIARTMDSLSRVQSVTGAAQ